MGVPHEGAIHVDERLTLAIVEPAIGSDGVEHIALVRIRIRCVKDPRADIQRLGRHLQCASDLLQDFGARLL